MNVVLPTCVHFLGNMTSSPDVFFIALYDMLHVLCIGNPGYFSLCLWFLANIKDLSQKEKIYYQEVFLRNPHFLQGIGIELIHGLHFLLAKDTASLVTEAQLNERVPNMALYQSAQAFKRQRHGLKKKKSGSYSQPEIKTGHGERFNTQKIVATRVILDSMQAMHQGKMIDVENCVWNRQIRLLDRVKLPPQILRLGNQKSDWGINFKDSINSNLTNSDSKNSTSSSSNNNNASVITVESISVGNVTASKRKIELEATAVSANDVVLGLVEGRDYEMVFDTKGQTAAALLNKMNSRRDQGKVVTLKIQTSLTSKYTVKGDKITSQSRGTYSAFANPLIKKLDESLLTKMEGQQANFHRLHDDGTKKAWTHPHIEALRNNYEKIKNVLTRDVSNTEATDRPIFTTNEKHVGTDDKKEPAMMTKLCTTIHAMVNKKDEDEDLL